MSARSLSSNGRSLRSSSEQPPDRITTSEQTKPLIGAAKRKRSFHSSKDKSGSNMDANSRPKIHAQRKFAQGQGSAPSSPIKLFPRRMESIAANQSSSSLGVSAPTSKSTSSGNQKGGDRPKTEDFLTFLCLRGTSMLPPELDFFNKATLSTMHNSSEDESSEEGTKTVVKKTIKRIKTKERHKEIKKTVLTKNSEAKKLPSSVQALRQKYADQRMAKTVVTKTLTTSAKKARSKNLQPSISTRSSSLQGPMTRSSGRGLPASRKPRVEIRKVSTATLIAKRKAKMASLNAASRMLTRLTPRGTSKAAFLRSTKKISSSRSLRGREISLSSEEEDEEDSKSQKCSKNVEGKNYKSKKQPKKSQKEENAASESDADAETSSRDSSKRRPSNKIPKSKKLLDLTRKRVLRSESRESSVSKESEKGTTKSGRPSRKTKEAATVYLNMIGQKLTSKKIDDDNISIESLSEVTQEKRMNQSVADASKTSSKESTPQRKIIVPAIKKNGSNSKSKKDNSEKKKAKQQSLRELQDMLLEEAKKNIVSKNVEKTDSDIGESDERITISQKTGYIQVKPRKSIDQPEEEKDSNSSAMPKITLHEGNSMTPVSLTTSGRRLSKSNVERTSTPPRRILPKTEIAPVTSTLSGGKDSLHSTSHIPMGVIGASRIATCSSMSTSGVTSNSPLPNASTLSTSMNISNPIQGNHAQMSQQPLVITTSYRSITPSSQTGTLSVSFPPGSNVNQTHNIILPNSSVNSAMRMPLQVANPVSIQMQRQGTAIAQPLQNHNFTSGSVQGVSIIGSSSFPLANMQPITIQPISSSVSHSRSPFPTMIRQPFNYQQPPVLPNEPVQHAQPMAIPPTAFQAAKSISAGTADPMLAYKDSTPPPLSCVVSTACTSLHSNTEVSAANSQKPHISPGPPLLSPQIGNEATVSIGETSSISSTAFMNTEGQSTLLTDSKPIINEETQRVYMAHERGPHMQGTNDRQGLIQQFPILPEATSQAKGLEKLLVEENQRENSKPSVDKLKKKNASQPMATPEELKNSSKSENKNSKTIFSKAPRIKSEEKASTPFRVENESSPYAFEPEPAEETAVPFRKSKSVKSSSTNKSAEQSKLITKTFDDGKTIVETDQDSDNSIPIPKELATQLAAKAKKEGNPNDTETTYFIPLQTSSGHSFGVAVKLGTDGPAGPNQKVVMKAKLVTQPSSKPEGATVIGSQVELDIAKDSKGSGSKFPRMPVASSFFSKDEKDQSDSDQASPSTSVQTSVISTDTMKKRSCFKSLKNEGYADTCLGKLEVLERFPKLGQHAHLVEAPVFKPTESEFKDPMKYIERIRPEAEQFGICKIIPPPSFKPECNVDDDMRFTAYNQFIQKVMNRWGPNVKEMAAIRKYLETQNITLKNPPMIGGVEIDLPALFHAVQSFGGLTEVIQRKRWAKIAEYLRLPKGTQDVGNKLDDIYCKYLLPYDTLSPVERDELLRLVEEEFEEKYKKELNQSKSEGNDEEDDDEESDDEEFECVVKGRSTSLSGFYRVARNVIAMLFRQSEPDPRVVEEEFWRLVVERDAHVLVQQGSIDTGDEGFGFPTTRASSCGRHPWNLKILSNNPKSLLRCMGPVMGVTVPTLNVSMVFTAGCWYRDPHGLPWIDYLHTGASKIWYGVPDSHSIAFYTAMRQLVPTFCKKKKIWLPADTAMVAPNLLVKHGVPVCRTVQEPGQFLVVFPKTYTSYVATGYSISESVFYAPRDYLGIAEAEFNAIRDSCEPMMFPLSKLLLSIAQDEISSKETLRLVKPFLENIRDNEYVKRTMLADLGVKQSERISLKTSKQDQEDEYECEVCSENLYVSYVCDVKEDRYFCKDHAIEYLQDKRASQRKQCKIYYTHSKEEISTIIKLLNKRLDESSDESSSSDDEIEVRRFIEKRKPPVVPSSPPPSVASMLSPVPSTSGIPSSQSNDESSTAKSNRNKKAVPPPVKKESSTKKKEENKPRGKRQKSKSTNETVRVKVEDESANESEEEEEEEDHVPLSKRRRKEVEKEKNESSVSKRRNTKARKAAHHKTGNLAVEYLDMLLSASEDGSAASTDSDDSSDEAWK